MPFLRLHMVKTYDAFAGIVALVASAAVDTLQPSLLK